MKSISTINPAITENTDGTIVKARAPVIVKKSGCVALIQCICMLCFASRSSNVWLLFLVKNNVTSPLLALHLLKCHTKAIMRIPQIVTYAVKEKGIEYKGEQR